MKPRAIADMQMADEAWREAMLYDPGNGCAFSSIAARLGLLIVLLLAGLVPLGAVTTLLWLMLHG